MLCSFTWCVRFRWLCIFSGGDPWGWKKQRFSCLVQITEYLSPKRLLSAFKTRSVPSGEGQFPKLAQCLMGFHTILIRVWFAWRPFSLPHIHVSDSRWPQRGCTHLDECQGNAYTAGDVLRTLQSLLLLVLLLSWDIFLPWTVSQWKTLKLTSLTRETHLPFFICDRNQRKVTSAGLRCSSTDIDSRKANP